MDTNGHSTDKIFLVVICINGGEVQCDHKWSLKTHLDTHCDASCEVTCLGAVNSLLDQPRPNLISLYVRGDMSL